MAEQEREDKGKVFDNLSGTQKSAILMMLLGEDEASEILKNLTPKEVQHIGQLVLCGGTRSRYGKQSIR